MINWLLRRWYAYQRKIDIDVLWPSCRKFAQQDLERARAMFALHAYNDRAWLVLGYTEMDRIIRDLY